MHLDWEMTAADIPRLAGLMVLLMANLFLLLYLMESRHRAEKLRRFREQGGRLHPEVTPFARRVLLAMTILQRLKERVGYLPLLIVAWLVMGQGSLLLRVATLGLVVGGAAVHRMTLSHRPLVQRLLEGRSVAELEAGSSGALVTTEQTGGEVMVTPALWRHDAEEKPWLVLSKLQVALLLLLVNGLLALLIYL